MNVLIFLIIMIWIISKTAARNKKAADSRQKEAAPASEQKYVQESFADALTPKKPAAKGNTVQTGKQTAKSKAAQTARKEEVSTTEYLRQKALQDQIEHRTEARREAEVLRRETGGRMVGLRYIDGDSIPSDTRLVTCSYCRAQNLISNRRKKQDYTCYFCREVL